MLGEGTAPLHEAGAASTPAGGAAYWLRSTDGVRVRVAQWQTGARGTVVFFQGRTEFIEKYYEPIGKFIERGFSAVAIDWRGQGLSDRAFADRRKGYVRRFADFQKDVDALMAFLRNANPPKPWVLVGHSMGGCISARTLMRQTPGLARDLGELREADGAPPFQVCLLSAPMLGLFGSAASNALASYVSWLSVMMGMGGQYAAGVDRRTAVDHGFNDNFLTTDAKRFVEYSHLVTAHDDLVIGGPTWRWLYEAYREMAQIRPTATPLHLSIGVEDRVVSIPAAEYYVSKAQNASIRKLPVARHEPFIECDAAQEPLWTGIDAFLAEQRI